MAWSRIEKTLYKFELGRATVFSMWTQFVVLVCLAHVKKETRDAVNVRKWVVSGGIRVTRLGPAPHEGFILQRS